ncbi:unnamed protein product [Phytophthora lilii]|uniref:Unnamed protein product n=1 Tax=Phytophthora lilii TaxID=2077276 RepID=A0A9W6WWJ0_9STRA|nr:unnamed protein product [Phytophthora lilii]
MQTPRRASASPSPFHQLTLQEVDRVLVSNTTSRRQGATYYTLEVFIRTSTDPPRSFDAGCLKLSDGEGVQMPAYTIEKTIAEFDSLRQALYSASHLAHTYASCELCKEMILYMDNEDKIFSSSMFRLVMGREKVHQSLQQLVDDVLDMLLHFSSIETTPWCSGQGRSHQVVRQFLLPRAADS